MTGITLEDFSQSRVYQEIFGLGEARGEALGEARGQTIGEANVILRLFNRRCGSLLLNKCRPQRIDLSVCSTARFALVKSAANFLSAQKQALRLAAD